MRVIVNGIPLLDLRSGVGNYVYHTFKVMLSIHKEWDIDFYYGLQWSKKLKDRPVASFVRARRFTEHLRKIYPLYRNTLALLFAVGQGWKKFDLYHETNYVPMQFAGPTVLTIFDLSFHYFPETHPIERIRYLDRHFYSRLNRVSHFITISDSVKQEMIDCLSLPQDKITVIPLGVEDCFTPISIDQLSPITEGYGLKPRAYILYVGTIEPRKNVFNLLKAYSLLPLSLRVTYPLVLVGEKSWLMEKLDKEIERLNIQRTIIKTGYVSREDLPALYSGATIFVYPSRYEGFGLPPLEAMACGVPVVTSSVSSLPEVVGDAGVLVHPEDIERMAKEIQDLLNNSRRRQMLSARGLERSKCFTWRKCAVETLQVYDRMVQNV
ncbi:MAG: glycosyltransferase [Gammaproteobacteria bacterium]|nr:glycosyltransferase [Gammaproteobacteria bacterium]